MIDASPSEETEGLPESGNPSSVYGSRFNIPESGIVDGCTLCDYGILTVTCNVCLRETHRKCAEAFLRGTDKRIDTSMEHWKCPRCLTMTHLVDPTNCEKKKELKLSKGENLRKRWFKF